MLKLESRFVPVILVRGCVSLPEDWPAGWRHDQEVRDQVAGPFMMRMEGEKR